jgi:hypothetical protein
MLSKDQILKADDLKTSIVDVPEWGGQVQIKQMSGSDRDAFEQATYRKNGSNYEVNLRDMRARLCAMCIVDESGSRMFEDKEISDLSKKSAVALDRVFSACQELNALSNKDVEELGKDLGQTQTDGSISV